MFAFTTQRVVIVVTVGRQRYACQYSMNIASVSFINRLILAFVHPFEVLEDKTNFHV